MTKVFAHRGCTEGFVANTLEAFVEARRRGADGVEFDVRRSLDGALVVHHDAEVPGCGLIHETRVADLPPHVPLLAEVIEASSGMAMNVEIKNLPGDPGHDPSGALSRAVAAELADHGLGDASIVSSFDAATIEAFRAAEPSIPIGWLLGATAPLDRALEIAQERAYQALHPNFVLVTAPFVERCHHGGLAVNVWTPNEDRDLEAMLAAGVDTLITDRLSAALGIAARRGAQTSP